MTFVTNLEQCTMAKGGMNMEDFKRRCEEATAFIVSCFDENNEKDGLTFDQRVELRAKELPEDIRSIICATTGGV